jgi:hypothetical protein
MRRLAQLTFAIRAERASGLGRRDGWLRCIAAASEGLNFIREAKSAAGRYASQERVADAQQLAVRHGSST